MEREDMKVVWLEHGNKVFAEGARQ